jgi:hypothetical protein
MSTKITYNVQIGEDLVPVVFTAYCYYKQITTGREQIYPAINGFVEWEQRLYTPHENAIIFKSARSLYVKQLLINKFEEENPLD